MPKMRRKSDLPTKTCAAWGLPFAWRRKWERDWDRVRYCSDCIGYVTPNEAEEIFHASLNADEKAA